MLKSRCETLTTTQSFFTHTLSPEEVLINEIIYSPKSQHYNRQRISYSEIILEKKM